MFISRFPIVALSGWHSADSVGPVFNATPPSNAFGAASASAFRVGPFGRTNAVGALFPVHLKTPDRRVQRFVDHAAANLAPAHPSTARFTAARLFAAHLAAARAARVAVQKTQRRQRRVHRDDIGYPILEAGADLTLKRAVRVTMPINSVP
ncbi:MAG TPA: DUF4054 domain-containing protein [Sneathiellales bacterium]|nr:DUF4054 domain-containing protein [Sneathiellales bacterium]